MSGSAAGLAIVIGVVVLACAWGCGRRRREGRFSARDAATLVSSEEIGRPLGERATLLQFSSPHCQPCRPTRSTLAAASSEIPGVAHVDVDAPSRMDLVRKLGVRRTPTVFVLDAEGTVRRKSTGVPSRADVLDALAALEPARTNGR